MDNKGVLFDVINHMKIGEVVDKHLQPLVGITTKNVDKYVGDILDATVEMSISILKGQGKMVIDVPMTDNFARIYKMNILARNICEVMMHG